MFLPSFYLLTIYKDLMLVFNVKHKKCQNEYLFKVLTWKTKFQLITLASLTKPGWPTLGF